MTLPTHRIAIDRGGGGGVHGNECENSCCRDFIVEFDASMRRRA